MTAAGNRNALNREVGVDRQRDWSHGVLDCSDECGLCMSTCFSCFLADPIPLAGCWAVWCPSVVYSKSKERLQHLQSQGTPLPGPGEGFSADCLVYGCLAICGYGWLLQVS